MAARHEVTFFIYRTHCFCCVNQLVLMLTRWNTEVCINARSPPALLLFIGHVTKQTTVKWSIRLEITWKRNLITQHYSCDTMSIVANKTTRLFLNVNGKQSLSMTTSGKHTSPSSLNLKMKIVIFFRWRNSKAAKMKRIPSWKHH